MNQLIEKYKSQFEKQVRKQCDKLTEKQKKIVVITFTMFFFCLALYVFANSLYNIGMNEGKNQIQHIESFNIRDNLTLKK